MARTITIIYDSLIAEKQAQSALNSLSGEGTGSYAAQLISDLNSGSKVALWRLLLWLVAFAAWTIENLMDNFKVEITTLAQESIAGNSAWLVAQAQLFEYGNTTLSVSSDRKAVYATSNTANQIIKFAAVGRENGIAVLKVAKADKASLSSPELLAFTAYIDRIRFAGTRISVVSRAANYLNVGGVVYYSGLANLSEVQSNVSAAITAALNNIAFNTEVDFAKLTDAVQAVDGISTLRLRFYLGSAELTDPTWLPSSGFALLDSLEPDWIAV